MAGAIPTDASAVVMTLTGHQAAAPGFIQAIPTGGATALGSSSNINLDRAKWVADGVRNRLQVFDASVYPPVARTTVDLPAQPRWLAVSLDGRLRILQRSTDPGSGYPSGRDRARRDRGEWRDVASAVPGQSAAGGRPPSAVVGNLTRPTPRVRVRPADPDGHVDQVGSTSTLNINGPNRIVAAANILNGVTGSITVHNQSATNLVYDVTGLFL
jgi:hypothetical protein